jgi:hypothetical protein
MLLKMWIFALVLAVAVAPLPLLAAAPGAAAGGLGTGSDTAGTAASNASTPSGKMDPAGARPSSEASEHTASKSTSQVPANK